MNSLPSSPEQPTASEQQLITVHLELAGRRAGALALQEGYNHDEAYVDAVIGLWKAAQKYDPEHANSASFETFATHKIDGAIRDGWRGYHGRRDNRPSVLRNDSAMSLDVPLDPSTGTVLGDTLISSDPTPEEVMTDAMYDRSEADVLFGLINQLPPRPAEALQLHLSGLTYKEIGEKMGMTEAGAKKAQTRAVNTLRKLYDERN